MQLQFDRAGERAALKVVGGNLFFGEDDHTFFGQFERANNLYASLRCGF